MNAAVDTGPGLGSGNAGVDPVWWQVPRLCWTLLCRHWPQLLFWFLAQQVLYGLCMYLSTLVAGFSALLAYAGMSLVVLAQLVTTAMMFLVLKPSLSAVSGYEDGPAHAKVTTFPRDWTSALSAALLPFFAFYAGWGFLEEIRRGFAAFYVDRLMATWINQTVGAGQPLESLENWGAVAQVHGLWIGLLVAAVVRYIAKWRTAATGRLRWMLLATACEAYWVFVGVIALGNYIGQVLQVFKDTRAWQAITTWWQNPFVFHLPLRQLKELVAPAWDFVSTVARAAVLPIIWLAITAIIYGLDLRKRQQIDSADSRWGRLADYYGQSHFLVKRLVGKISGGWQTKGIPVVNSIRLVLRAGAPVLVILCVGWQLLAFVDSWGWRIAVHLIGPQDMNHWVVISNYIEMLVGNPNNTQPSLFTQVLRVVLLAATFDRALAQTMTRMPAGTRKP